MNQIFRDMDKIVETMDNAINQLKLTKMKDTYFNTTNQSGENLKYYKRKARSQDEEVLEIFKSPYTRNVSPEMVMGYLKAKDPEKYGNTPLTSVRRAFSNLKNRSLIYKTGTLVKGDYGRPVHVWALVK